MHLKQIFFVVVSVLACAGCTRDGAGMVITHDGRMVSETPEVANQEFAWHLAQRVATSAGSGWKATVTISENPTYELVKADEYGWSVMHVEVTIVPPRGVVVDPHLQQNIEAVAREAIAYRVKTLRQVTISTVIVDPGTPMPGSLHYTSVAGDTWAGISTAFYGTPQHWRVIADANPGVDAAPLPAGSELIIPPKP